MTIQEVIRVIDEEGGRRPFIITFFKADGTIRDMLALKRNKSRVSGGKGAEGSAFKYSLKHKNVALINELSGYSSTQVKTPIGTHIKLPEINLDNVRISAHQQKPKSVKLFAIKSFNGQQVIHE